MTSSAAIVACLVAVALLTSTPVHAQAAPQRASNETAAEALYDQAKAQLKAGENAKACALLEESQRLERAVGTTLLLGHCYEALGRTASAWALFREVQSASSDGTQRQRIARIRASVLESSLATLVIEYPHRDELRPGALRIRRDDADVPLSSLGVAVPVDPGRHTVIVSSTSGELWSTTVEVSPGALARVVIPSVQRKEVALASPLPAQLSSPQDGSNDVVFEREPRSAGTLPWLLTGLGAASVLAGVTVSITAHNKYAQSEGHCRTRTLCDDTGLDLRSDAQTQAAWATGLAVGGAASLVSAGLLFVLNTGSNTALYVQPVATARTMSLSVGGTL